MTVVAVVWSGVDCVDAIVVGRGGQWRINKEEETNDERGGGSAAVATVSLVSHDPAGRDLLNFFLTKESRYSNSRHTIVTALSPSVRRHI